jgi:hypothetical protein
MFTFVWVYGEYSIATYTIITKWLEAWKRVWKARMEQYIASKETYFEGNNKYM